MNTTRALASINARFFATVLLSAVLLVGRIGSAAYAEPRLAVDAHANPAAKSCPSARS